MFVHISTQVNTKTKDITDNLRLKVTFFFLMLEMKRSKVSLDVK